MNKKVLFCASSASHLELFHQPYINYFKSLGYEVHIATNSAAKGVVADRKFVLEFSKRYFSLKNIFTVLKLAKIMKMQRYDIISTHATLAGMLARAAKLFSKQDAILVHTCHGYLFDESSSLKNKLHVTVERFLGVRTNLLITMNSEDKRLAEKYELCNEIRFVHGCGLNQKKFYDITQIEAAQIREEYGIGEGQRLLLYPAEFSKRKNHALLLNGFAQALTDGCDCNCRLLLAGDGRLKKKCLKLVDSLNISGNVTFCGYVRDMNRLYSIADVAVSTSLCEGMPFNVMEALHKNIPIAASRIKGHTDLITDGVNGLLFSPDNSSELAACIVRLLSDSELYGRIKAESRLAEDYYLKNAFKEITEIYNEARILSQN